MPRALIGFPVEAPFEVIDPRAGFDPTAIPADFDALFRVPERSGISHGVGGLGDFLAAFLVVRLTADDDGLTVRAYYDVYDSDSGTYRRCRGDTTFAELADDGSASAYRALVEVDGAVPLRFYDVSYRFGLGPDLTPRGVEVRALVDALDIGPVFGDEPGELDAACGWLDCMPCAHDAERTCARVLFHDFALVRIEEPLDGDGGVDRDEIDEAPLCAGPDAGDFDFGEGCGGSLCSALGPVSVGGWLLGAALLLLRRRRVRSAPAETPPR